MTVVLVSAFTLGLLSTMHCMAMCGSIAGALTASLDMKIKLKNKDLFSYIMAYNVGRIVSYALAGALAGSLGFGLIQVTSIENGHMYLRSLSDIFLILIGLYLVGWFPKLGFVQSMGQPLWKGLEPLGRKILPVKTHSQAFVFGMVWGWLPCVIVYTTLLWTVLAGGAVQGMSIMLAFGAGTLPFVIATGFFATSMIKCSQQPLIRKGAGFVLIVIATISLITHMH